MTTTEVATEPKRPVGHMVEGSAIVGIPAAQQIILEEAGNRPAWLPNGCPPWCENDGLHKDSDCFEDRVHSGPSIHITLTAEEPPLGPDVAADGKRFTGKSVPYDEPAEADVHLMQHYREASPRVWVGRDGSRVGMHLTLDEAEQLAHQVLKRVFTGRLKRMTGNGRVSCPVWCVDDHTSPQSDDEHISEARSVPLAAHPYTATATSGESMTYHASVDATIAIDDGEPPYISVAGHDEKPGSRMTADEADQLADILHSLAAMLRFAQ